MPEPCIDIAKKVHQPQFDIDSVIKAIPGCNPAFGKCIKDLSGSSDGMYSRFNKLLVQATS
jgi:hypothetical protein